MRTRSLSLLASFAIAGLPGAAMAAPFAVPDLPAADALALKLSAEHSQSSDGHEWAVPNVELMVPVTRGLEVAAVIGRSHVHQTGARPINGISDLELAIKWELLPVPEAGSFGITVQPVLLAPLGDRDLSGRDWRVEFPVVFGWRQGPLRLHAMMGYSALLSDRGDTILFGTLATYDIGETLTFGVELVGSAPASNVDAYEAEIGAGAAYAFAENWTLEARIGRTIRLEDGSKSTNFMLAIEKSF